MRYTITLSLGLLLIACSDNTEQKPPSGFDLSESPPDATPDMPPVQEDMPVEPAKDMTPPRPIRTLVERPPLQGIDPGNRVKDPAFRSMGVAFDWLTQPAGAQGFSPATAYRRTMEEVPVPGMPVLHLPKSPINPDGLQTYGTLIHDRAPSQVGVWIGRIGPETAEPQIIVTGLDVNDPTNYLGKGLVPVPQTTQTIGEYTWTWYQADVVNFVGYGYLVITDNAPEALYVQAPSALSMEVGPGLLRAPGGVTARALTRTERLRIENLERAARDWRQRQRERHHLPRTFLPPGIR